MKFNEYLELKAILENKGTSINEVFKLNEAGETTPTVTPPATAAPTTTPAAPVASTASAPGNIDKEKGNILTTSGRLKMKLNTVAKTTQQKLSDQILKKYLPKILATEKAQVDKIIAGTKGVTNPEQKKALVDQQMKAISAAVNQQYTIIDNAITKFIQTSTLAITQKITTSSASDKNKMLLSNYWTLLSTQIMMNASMYIVAQRSKLINTLYGNDQKSAEAAKALAFAETNKKLAEEKATTASLKQKVSQLSTELDSQKAATPVKVIPGNKYTRTGTDGKIQTVIASGTPAVPGKTNVSLEATPKTTFAVDTTSLKPIVTDASTASTTTPAPTTNATPA